MTLKLLPIGNKTVLRDSRILSVVEKWSSEELLPPGTGTDEHPATATTAESATDNITEGMELEHEQDGSPPGTEASDENNASAGDVAKQTEAVGHDDDAEIHQRPVSSSSTVVNRVFSLHTIHDAVVGLRPVQASHCSAINPLSGLNMPCSVIYTWYMFYSLSFLSSLCLFICSTLVVR